ncbi:MAG: dTMP kinase [Candidatus Helarchaeota archaeon]
MPRKGKFIVLEGIDGSGTTTHAKLLESWLRKKGYLAISTSEPTNGKIGMIIRNNLKIGSHMGEKVKIAALDALLFAADRIEHWETFIKPNLNAGYIVISDRYIESSLAYQTAAGLPFEWIQSINQYIELPDLTILLDIDAESALQRKLLPLEKYENIKFLKQVRQNYLKRANFCHYPIINTNNLIEEVQLNLQKIILDLL